MYASPLLGPVVALVAWSLVMMIWMIIARGVQLRGRDLPAGARGTDLERDMPGKANWPSHNYNHLLEQPTIFYAIVFALVFMGFDASINVWLAWAYVGFRILHSLLQATVNVVKVRFLLFLLSSLCLIALTTHAALKLVLHH